MSSPANAANSPLQLLRRQGSAIPQALAVSALLQLEGVLWYLKAAFESWLHTRFFCTAEISNCHWLVRWLAAQPSAQKAREFLVERVTATNSEGGAKVYAQPAVSLITWFVCDVFTGKTKPLTLRTLCDMIWWKYAKRTPDRNLSIISYTEQEEYHGMANHPTSRTMLRMVTRDRSKLEQLLCTLRGADEMQMSDYTTIWEARNGEWEESNNSPKKPWSSVCLAPGKSEAMLADAQSFWTEETHRWYRKRSLAHRRGYILYGPPGSGKSCEWQLLLLLCRLRLTDSFTVRFDSHCAGTRGSAGSRSSHPPTLGSRPGRHDSRSAHARSRWHSPARGSRLPLRRAQEGRRHGQGRKLQWLAERA